MPERDGRDQGEDSPMQARSCLFARHFLLAISGAKLYHPSMTFSGHKLFCYVLFRFRLLTFFIESAALASDRSSLCMRPDSHS